MLSSPAGYKLQQQSRTLTHTYSCILVYTHIHIYSHARTHTREHAANWINSQIKFFTTFAQLTWQPAAACVCVCVSASARVRVCECIRSSLPFKGSMKCKGNASFSSMSEFDSVFPNDSISRIRIHVRILVLHWLLGRFDWAPFKSVPPTLFLCFFFQCRTQFCSYLLWHSSRSLSLNLRWTFSVLI